MKMIYLYTTLNWYRIELFRSLSKIVDLHIFILNGYSVAYTGIGYTPEYEDLNISFVSKDESKFSEIVKILDREDFDSIVVPSMNDFFYLELTTRLSRYYYAKGKTVIYFWEYWPMEKGSYNFSKWIKQEIRHIYTMHNKSYIDYFITPSINTYSFYQKIGIPSHKLIRCVNASEIIDKKEVDRNVRRELGIREDEKVILFFGRLESYKGANQLIAAFSKLQNKKWHLVICGPGEETILTEISQLKEILNRVHIMGSVNTTERSVFYQAADLFVLPNTYKGKIEPWGLTVNEAMSFGLPILASNATGSAIDLIFPGVNGYIMDATHLESELCFYIEHILSNDELRISMGRKSAEISKIYSFDNMARSFYVAAERGHLRKER